jgi:hypothetical protein
MCEELVEANDEDAAFLLEQRRLLLSRDPRAAVTSGQWMTESTGGSDLRYALWTRA